MHSSSNRVRGSGFGVPPADTGNFVLNWISDTLTSVVHLERRIDPFVRPAFDALFRDRLSELITNLINARRKDEGYKLAEERTQSNEEEYLQDIINSFNAQMRRLWNPGYFERGGNTKTHGVLRAEFVVATTCRNTCGAAFSPSPVLGIAPMCGTRGLDRSGARISTTSAS